MSDTQTILQIDTQAEIEKIIRQLDLLSPRYLKTAAYGHFGRREFPWERADQVAALQNAVF